MEGVEGDNYLPQYEEWLLQSPGLLVTWCRGEPVVLAPREYLTESSLGQEDLLILADMFPLQFRHLSNLICSKADIANHVWLGPTTQFYTKHYICYTNFKSYGQLGNKTAEVDRSCHERH